MYRGLAVSHLILDYRFPASRHSLTQGLVAHMWAHSGCVTPAVYRDVRDAVVNPVDATASHIGLCVARNMEGTNA